MVESDVQRQLDGSTVNVENENGQIENLQKELKQNLPREVSIDYPYYSLEESIKLAKTIYKVSGRTSCTSELLASALNCKTTTNSFTYSISSARQFGLLTKTKDVITLTNNAKQIIAPIPDTKIEDVLKELVTKPQVYKKLIEKFNGLDLPETNVISNLLLHEGVVPTKKDRAADVFVKSIQYAGILDQDHKINIGSEEVKPENKEVKPENKEPVNNNGENELVQPDIKKIALDEPTIIKGQQSLYLGLANNRNVTIVLPMDITVKEVDRLKKMLDLAIVD